MSAKGKRTAMGAHLLGGASGSSEAGRSANRAPSLSVAFLEPNPEQPRKTIEGPEFERLVASVRNDGVITPLTALRLAPDRYRIIAGERRWRAAGAAGLKHVPVHVLGNAGDEGAEALAKRIGMIENIHRKDLNPVEYAEGMLEHLRYELAEHGHGDENGGLRSAESVRTLLLWMHRHAPDWPEEHENTPAAQVIEAAFEPMDRSWRSFAKRYVFLTQYPSDVKDALRAETIDMATARALAQIDDDTLRADLLGRAAGEGLNARQVRDEIARAERTGAAAGAIAERVASGLDGAHRHVQSARKRLARLTPEDAKRLPAREVDEALAALEQAGERLARLLDDEAETG